MNRSAFYASARSRTSGIFGTSLSQGQVSGCEAILDEAERRGTPLKHLAYILATAYHESAHTMQPVRETLASTDDGAIAALEKAWRAGNLSWVKTPYWRKDGDGKSWFGRGLVQITHKDNYDKFGLTDNPSKALEMSTAIRVIFDGMDQGLFTGNKLSDYIGDDYVNARRIVNGTDRASMIAGYAKAFEAALVTAGYAAKAASPGAEPTPAPLKPAPVPQSPPAEPAPQASWVSALAKIITTVFGRNAA